MSFKSRFLIALQKIAKSKSRSIKCILCLSLISFILIFMGGISVVVKHTIEKLVYSSASMCYVEAPFFPDKEIMREVSEYKKYEQLLFSENFADAVLKVNNKEYRGRNITDWKINSDSKDMYQLPVMVDRYSKGSCLFSDVDLKELNAKFGKKNAVICGSDKLEESGIVISDYVLKLFGLSEEDFDDFIGQSIELTVTDFNGEKAALGPYKLIGIADSDMFKLEADYYLAQIIIVDSKYHDDNYSGTETIRFYSRNFEDCTQLNDLFRTLGLSEEYNSVLEAYNALNLLRNILLKVFAVILSVLILALLSGYLMTVYFEYCEEKNFEQIQKVIGMKESDLFLISAIKDLIYVLCSEILGGVIAYLAFLIVDYEANWNLDIHLMPSWQLFASCALLTLLGLIVISLIKTIVYRKALSKERLSESLSTGEM